MPNEAPSLPALERDASKCIHAFVWLLVRASHFRYRSRQALWAREVRPPPSGQRQQRHLGRRRR
jgi:hypothetical protein